MHTLILTVFILSQNMEGVARVTLMVKTDVLVFAAWHLLRVFGFTNWDTVVAVWVVVFGANLAMSRKSILVKDTGQASLGHKGSIFDTSVISGKDEISVALAAISLGVDDGAFVETVAPFVGTVVAFGGPVSVARHVPNPLAFSVGSVHSAGGADTVVPIGFSGVWLVE